MRKHDKDAADDALPEYDFSEGVRGKYAARYRAGSNLVLLDPDVAAIFKDAASVNRVLRAVASIAAREARAPRGRTKKNKR
jgi:hypothetical protein